MWGLALFAPVAISSAAVMGCKGGSGAGGGQSCLKPDNCYDYTCYKPGKTRSFRTDVLPIFEQSCSLSSSCHGTPSSPTTSLGYQPYLGSNMPKTTPSDVAKIISTIVGAQSPTATNEKIVDPGHPETSFLMQKMDGTVKCASLTCIATGCGTGMPQNIDPLPAATRDTVRDWIKQGAMNN